MFKQDYTTLDWVVLIGSVLTIGVYYVLGIINIGSYFVKQYDDAIPFIGYTCLGVLLFTLFIGLLYKAMDSVTTFIGNQRKHIRLSTTQGAQHPKYRILKHIQIVAPGVIMMVSNYMVYILNVKAGLLPVTKLFVIQMQVIPLIYAVMVVLEEVTGLRIKLEQDIEGY